ncbi:hypothetical protein BDV59DRAFT_211538 [Aspergillus ambiguus]|uniref:uncharacterized protein n=1 Tax=Aspergillus ambiguus TaxID=176160 RepID=UPI003CCC9D0D
MNLLAIIFHLILRFISRLGSPHDGDLLYIQFQTFWMTCSQNEKHISKESLSRLLLSLICGISSSLICYIMGHVFPTMFILESERMPTPSRNNDNEQQKEQNYGSPVFQSPLKAFNFLCNTGGTPMVFRGLSTGVIYHLCLSFLKTVLHDLVGLSILARALLDIISCILLSELHLSWTHATICARRNLFTRPVHNARRWSALLIPTLVYATAGAAMLRLPHIVYRSGNLIFPYDSDPKELFPHLIAFGEVFTLLPRVLIRVLVLIPATIALTLVEARFLDDEEATILPDAAGRRRAKMRDFAEGKMRLVKKDNVRQGVYRFVRGKTFIGLCRLHIVRSTTVFITECAILWAAYAFGVISLPEVLYAS